MKKQIDTVVWDADNTMWDWITMHLAGMRAMANKISDVTGISEEEVRGSMGRVYGRAGTFDYKPLIQEMDVIEKWAKGIQPEREKIARVIDLAMSTHTAYTQSRHETFRMYPDVPEVLSELETNEVRNVVLSDAPISKVIRRLKRFGIDRHFNLICGRPEPMVDEQRGKGEEALKHYEDLRRQGDVYRVKGKTEILVDQKKPDVKLAPLLGKKEEEVKESVVVVGDNFEKDPGTAHKNECYGLYARFGAADIDSVSGLYDFAPPTVVNRNAAGVDLSKQNLEMIQAMGDKLQVVDNVREILHFVLGRNDGQQ